MTIETPEVQHEAAAVIEKPATEETETKKTAEVIEIGFKVPLHVVGDTISVFADGTWSPDVQYRSRMYDAECGSCGAHFQVRSSAASFCFHCGSAVDFSKAERFEIGNDVVT